MTENKERLKRPCEEFIAKQLKESIKALRSQYTKSIEEMKELKREKQKMKSMSCYSQDSLDNLSSNISSCWRLVEDLQKKLEKKQAELELRG